MSYVIVLLLGGLLTAAGMSVALEWMPSHADAVFLGVCCAASLYWLCHRSLIYWLLPGCLTILAGLSIAMEWMPSHVDAVFLVLFSMVLTSVHVSIFFFQDSHIAIVLIWGWAVGPIPRIIRAITGPPGFILILSLIALLGAPTWICYSVGVAGIGMMSALLWWSLIRNR